MMNVQSSKLLIQTMLQELLIKRTQEFMSTIGEEETVDNKIAKINDEGLIELTFYKERLGLANLFVGGDNADKKIFSYYKDDVSMGDPGSCEYFLPTRQFDLNVYIEEYPNVP